MNIIIGVGFILCLTLLSDAKVFKRCELAKELSQNTLIERSFISHWICLVEAESNANSSKVEKFPNLSSSYGLFQINSKVWCREGRKGGDCNKKCEDFIDDNIKDDIECARIIFERNGFKNWKGWETRCKSNKVTEPNPLLPVIKNCDY